MKSLELEKVNSFDINHTFFFTTEKSNMSINYTSLANFINAYNGDITIYPTYSFNGEDVRMEGIKGDSPALYVAIMDSVHKYFERIEENGICLNITEKEVVNILCDILHLSKDREEAISNVGEWADAFDFEPENSHIEDSQVALMEYLPVFYNTTESAYTYYCDVMRLTEEKDKLSDARYAFHRLQDAMAFPKNMAKETVRELMSFEEWEDTVSISRYIHRIESQAFLYFNDAVKIDGSVLADMYIDSACEDSAIVSEVVTSENISLFISNALDDLEEDLDDRLLSSASIVLSIDKKRYKFDVTHALYGIYEDEMLASGYTEDEIEEVNEVDF